MFDKPQLVCSVHALDEPDKRQQKIKTRQYRQQQKPRRPNDAKLYIDSLK